MSESERDYEVEGDDDESFCFHCAGEGWDECRNPLECTNAHNAWGECRCMSCGGTGRAKDMRIW